MESWLSVWIIYAEDGYLLLLAHNITIQVLQGFVGFNLN